MSVTRIGRREKRLPPHLSVCSQSANLVQSLTGGIMRTTFRFRGSVLAFALLVIWEYSLSARVTRLLSQVPRRESRGVSGLAFTGSVFYRHHALGIGSQVALTIWGPSLVYLSHAIGQRHAQFDITFTAPTGILGGQGATYLTTVVGSIF